MADLGINFNDLRSAIDWSVGRLETPRKKRLESIKQYVGAHYADKGADMRVPTNFLELAVTIYTHQLVSASPRAMVTTSIQGLRPFALDMELALNQVPDEIGLGETLHNAVLEALFCFGVVKVGIASSGREVLGQQYGEPFVDGVSIDDYFLDMSAKSHSGLEFEGNDYWIPLEDARAMWEGKESDLEPDEHTITGDRGEGRAESISSDEGADVYKDRVWLRDVWLPRQRKLVTYGVKSLKMFNVVEWDGPEHGPYHTLGFSEVPGNLLPLPPVALWRDLHELGNSVFRKLGKQADSKKTVAAFSGGNDDDIEALKKAKDGEGIRYNGAKPESITVGGIDPTSLAFFLQVKDLSTYFAGNLDTLGGLAPATDTVGQDKLLNEAATARLTHMRSRTNKFAKSIFQSIAWYEWTDPVRERTLDKPLEGTDIVIQTKWSEETREGDFLDFNTDIDVYSMQDESPSVRLQKLGTTMERFVMPFIEQIAAQGGQIDFKELLTLIAKLADVDELKDIVRFEEPYENADPAGNPNPTISKPAHTTRTYERVNRPGATRHGKDDTMSRILMGAGVQDSEAAALTRPAS